jgi:toxin-antitoxin system PIN domain toxin
VLLLDVNVVVAAYRPQHPQHEGVRAWWDTALAEGERFAVPSTVWASFLRIVTSRRVFTVPATPSEAFGFIEAVSGQPQCIPAEPGPRHLKLLRDLCEQADAAGDLVPDAVLAAIALEHGASVATFDRDFARFSSVRHVWPVASPPAV